MRFYSPEEQASKHQIEIYNTMNRVIFTAIEHSTVVEFVQKRIKSENRLGIAIIFAEFVR